VSPQRAILRVDSIYFVTIVFILWWNYLLMWSY
jgi:hypothetical protein